MRYGTEVACRPIVAALVDALLAAGFERTRLPPSAGPLPVEVFRRRLQGQWFLEARQQGPEGSVDVGLTVEPPGGAFIGPVHRMLSAGALATALPVVHEALAELAAASQSLRCQDCCAYLVSTEGPDGPFLACAQPMRPGRPFARGRKARQEKLRCRGNLAVPALVVHGEEG